jgi:hypothetical protein
MHYLREKQDKSPGQPNFSCPFAPSSETPSKIQSHLIARHTSLSGDRNLSFGWRYNTDHT